MFNNQEARLPRRFSFRFQRKIARGDKQRNKAIEVDEFFYVRVKAVCQRLRGGGEKGVGLWQGRNSTFSPMFKFCYFPYLIFVLIYRYVVHLVARKQEITLKACVDCLRPKMQKVSE